MERDKLKYTLEQLYEFCPELKNREEDLIVLIEKMIENKPNIQFDRSFALKLKEDILTRASHEESEDNKFNFNIMNRKIFIAAGSLIVASFLFVALINVFGPERAPDSKWNIASLVGNQKQEEKVTKLAAGSFGSLASLNATSGGEEGASSPLGLGSAEMAPAGGDASVSVDRMSAGSGGDRMMIMPMFQNYRYVYAGEEITLEDDTAAVYKRIKDQSTLARDLARTLSSFDFSGINLKGFDGLVVNNLSFSEDKEQGLMINFDLKEGNAYIFENWEKWRVAGREACDGDPACFDKYRVKESDIPNDTELVRMANSFMNKHGIDLSNYGEPQVDSKWREYYIMAEDKDNYYFPEQMTVVYPLMIEGKLVKDQSGNHTGLRVNVNVLHKKASGLSGLVPYRYEASDYALVKEASRVTALAEEGGWRRGVTRSENEEDLIDIQLGTPEFSYVQTWRHENNKSEELLVPALIFPVIDKPEFGYFGGDYVTVPLVQELVEELEKQQDEWQLYRGGQGGVIEPLPVIDAPEGVELLPSRGTGETGSAVEGEMRIMPFIE